MGTRATILFKSEYDEFHVYRGHDGYPENVIADIEATIEKAKGRWSGSEGELLVTLFLAMHYDFDKDRLPYYNITAGVHGDESYRYLVIWNSATKVWEVAKPEAQY